MIDVIINGISQDVVSFNDRGLMYGDGLFETMLYQEDGIRNIALHWNRLIKGCKKLSLPEPDIKLIESEIEQLVSKQTIRPIVVKLVITRGQSERGYKFSGNEVPTRIIALYTQSVFPDNLYRDGIAMHLCKTRLSESSTLAGIKHLNRLDQVLARNERDDSQYQEGLMLDSINMIVEGTMSNIFFVKNGKICTPRIKRCGIEGVMRQHVINQLHINNCDIVESDIPVEQLNEFEEVFITNSLIGVCPVKNIEDHHYSVPGKVTSEILSKII